MTTIRQQAGLDQTAAMLRDQRHKLLRMNAAARKRGWHENIDNIQVLLLYLVDQCGDRDEIDDTIRFVLSAPHKYRVEFVLAKCKQLDAK